jgi:hypothetical protein
MRTKVDDFEFNDFCLQCQKITQHDVMIESKQLFGVCSTCTQVRPMTDVKQVYYRNTDLWVTRFKIGNLPSVVAGKLLDTINQTKPK